MRLRSNLILLVIATAVPLVVLAVLASFLLVSHEQANFAAAVKDRNRVFMSAVDLELKGHVTSLQAITSLRSLVQGDLRAAHEDLADVAGRERRARDAVHDGQLHAGHRPADRR